MYLDDKKLCIETIRSGKDGRDKVIGDLYGNAQIRSVVKSVVYKSGGKENHFDMVLNTTLMQFIKTVIKNEHIVITTSIKSYIGGIARFVILQELRLEKKTQTVEFDTQYDIKDSTNPESLIIDQSKKDLIKEILSQTGKNCKEVLMHWANGYKMKEIARMMSYKSEGMAKKKKHQCFKQLLEYLNDNPHIKSILR